MSDTVLRSGLIRLAYANPDLRPALLPLIEKHAGEGDMAAVLDAEADPTSHDQNLPEHYYFGKTAEERLENIEKLLSQFASPKSKDQNKPQSYYGLPPKGKQAAAKEKFDYSPETGEVGKLRDDLVKALKKKGLEVEEGSSRNTLYIDGEKVAIHGPHLESDRVNEWVRKPSRKEWLDEAVKLLGKKASVGRTAMDFPSEEALKQYLRDHPNADKKNHKVRKDTTYEKHHAKVESGVKDKFNDVTSHLSDAGLSEDEAFGDREMSALGQKWFSVTRVKLNDAKKSADREKLNAVEKEMNDIAGKMKARITELAKTKKGKQASVKTAGAHPLGRMAIVYFDLAMEDYNIEEDADNGDEFAQSLMADPRKGLELESKAVKNLSRMFGARIMDEGHDSGGGLVCKFGVDSWADVKKALDVINRNHEGGDDQIGTDVPYMVARDFRLYPDGVNDVFYGEGSGAEGDWDEWLSEHKGKQASVKTAGGSGAANAAYLRQSPLKNKILQAVAKHYGTSVSAIEAELTDPDAEFVFEYIGNDRALAMAVYRDMKAKGLV